MGENTWLADQLNALNNERANPEPAVEAKPAAAIKVVHNQRFETVDTPEVVQEDPMMSVDQMIEQINCYRLLLNESLFVGQLSAVAEKVQDEIREFIVERIQILLGKKAPKVDSQFNETEVQALKMLATVAMKSMNMKPNGPSPILSKPAVKVATPQPQLKLRKIEEPVRVVEEPVATLEPEPVVVAQPQPVVQGKKKGRPAGSKKIVSPKPIVDKNTGEVKYPIIDTRTQVRPNPASGQVPLRMPAPNTVIQQPQDLINSTGHGSNY